MDTAWRGFRRQQRQHLLPNVTPSESPGSLRARPAAPDLPTPRRAQSRHQYTGSPFDNSPRLSSAASRPRHITGMPNGPAAHTAAPNKSRSGIRNRQPQHPSRLRSTVHPDTSAVSIRTASTASATHSPAHASTTAHSREGHRQSQIAGKLRDPNRSSPAHLMGPHVAPGSSQMRRDNHVAQHALQSQPVQLSAKLVIVRQVIGKPLKPANALQVARRKARVEPMANSSTATSLATSAEGANSVADRAQPFGSAPAERRSFRGSARHH